METGFLESIPYGGHFGQPMLLLLLVWFWYSSLGMPSIQYWVQSPHEFMQTKIFTLSDSTTDSIILLFVNDYASHKILK